MGAATMVQQPARLAADCSGIDVHRLALGGCARGRLKIAADPTLTHDDAKWISPT